MKFPNYYYYSPVIQYVPMDLVLEFIARFWYLLLGLNIMANFPKLNGDTTTVSHSLIAPITTCLPFGP
jgi:hypothetical protein